MAPGGRTVPGKETLGAVALRGSLLVDTVAAEGARGRW